MNLLITLEEAIRLEEMVSRCYYLLSMIAPDESLSWELNKLSLEEKNHVTVIKTGKDFAFKNPELFGKEAISDEEIRLGIRLTENLIDDLEQKRVALRPALKRVYDLEKKFEAIHMNTAVEFREPSLKQLFDALSKGDAEHRQRLEAILAQIVA